MDAWWSWLLTAVGVTGLYCAGRRQAFGWAIGLGAQVLWIAYGVATSQYGFIASALVYGATYWANFRRWMRQPPDAADASPRSRPSGRSRYQVYVRNFVRRRRADNALKEEE